MARKAELQHVRELLETQTKKYEALNCKCKAETEKAPKKPETHSEKDKRQDETVKKLQEAMLKKIADQMAKEIAESEALAEKNR